MTWSLQIRHGDFDVSNGQIRQVGGTGKLIQDFTAAVLESVGDDDMHFEWGSYLDGGIGPDGTQLPGVIGSAVSASTRNAIETEIRRVGTYIQHMQLARIKYEKQTYNKVTLTASEILTGISNIRVVQNQTRLDVYVTLTTGTGSAIDVPLISSVTS